MTFEEKKEKIYDFSKKVVSLLSAREDECYCGIYENGKEILAPCVLTLDEICNKIKDAECLLVGDGAVINREYFEKTLPKALFTSERNNMISASSMAEVALKKIENNEICDAEGLIPLYLRKSQAEREYDEKIKSKQG